MSGVIQEIDLKVAEASVARAIADAEKAGVRIGAALTSPAVQRQAERLGATIGEELSPNKAEVHARRYIEGLKRTFVLAQADTAEAVARGLITPAQARQRGVEAARAFNVGVLSQIEQLGKAGALSGRGGQGLFVELSGQLKNVGTTAIQSTRGINTLRGGLVSLASQAAGTSGPVGTLANGLLAMAGGSFLVLGVVAGIGAIIGIYNKLTERARATKKATDDLADSLRRQREEADRGADVELGAASKKLMDLRREIASQGLTRVTGRGFETGGRAATAAQLADLRRLEADVEFGERQRLARIAAEREAGAAAAAGRDPRSTGRFGAGTGGARGLSAESLEARAFATMVASGRLVARFWGELDKANERESKQASDAIIKARKDQIRDEQQAIVTALNQTANVLDAQGSGEPQFLVDAREARERMEELGRTIERSGRRAVDLAYNLGVVDDRMAGLLDALTMSVSAIPGLINSIRGGGALPIIGSALAVAGPALGVLSSLFGDSPEERARKEALLQNTQALHDLESGLRDANLSGVDAEKLGQALARTSVFGPTSMGGTAEGQRLTRAAFEAELRKVGLTMADATRIAEEMGIALDFTTKNMSQLANALRLSATVGYAQDYAGQIERLNDELNFLNIDDPIEKLKRFQQVLLGLGSPGLNELRGADLSTEFGRNSALKQLEILFEQFQGGASRSVLGNLTESEYLDALRDFSAHLDTAIEAAKAGAVPGLDDAQTVAINQSITRVEALRIDAQLTTANQYHREANDFLAQIAAYTGFIAGVRPMSAPNGFIGGSTTVGDLHFHGITGDPAALSDAVVIGLQEALGRNYQRSALAAGNVRL